MSNKNKKEIENKKIEKMSANRNNDGVLDKILADVSKKSAAQQIIIGALSGWATGYFSGKIGRFAAVTVGGAIILLEIAHEQGVIKLDWCKVSKKVDELGDKVQETVTGEGPKWMDKADRYLDRKYNQAEASYKRHHKKAKKWYSSLVGDESGPKINNFHIFLFGFAGGVAIGLGSS